jgi:DNA-binding NarL/FixJ family response regulator
MYVESLSVPPTEVPPPTGSQAPGLRLVLVEDSPLVRESLREMLSDIAGLQVTGEFDHAGEAIAAIDQDPPDVVLLDIKLRESNGMQVLRHVKEAHPRVKVIVFSSYSDERDRQRFLAAGADQFFSKTDQTEKLYQAVAALAQGA